MKLGAMTDPRREPVTQVTWMARNGFDFVELALEPPASAVEDLSPRALRSALEHTGLDAIVHASRHLPLASRHAAVERAAREELTRALELARALDALLLVVPNVAAPEYCAFGEMQDYYVGLFRELCAAAGSRPQVAIENSPRNEREVLLFVELFRHVPGVRLALDVGHANLNTLSNVTADFLREPILGGRLSHVYVSDNDGRCDLHLPLGAVRGGVDWAHVVGLLRKSAYDGTATLKVFSADPDYMLMSRDKFRAWWEAAG